ncbi:MAG: hypothetical protein HC867_07130 [Bacteroidia bacterium]|nr:hypothetical protein [Bacteroidia bacterium]
MNCKAKGTIISIANANPISTESYQQQQRKAWQGKCLAIIKSSHKAGKIVLKAKSKGLPSATITIETN